MARSWFLALVAGAFIGGCAPSHVYQPLDHAGAEKLSGRPAADYPVHGGRIEIAAVGTRKVALRQQLVVRLRVQNDSDKPWALDPLRQELRVGDGIARLPDQVRLKKNESIAPIMIPPHDARTIDLGFFLDGAAPPNRIQVAWRVSTPNALFSDHASFERTQVVSVFTHGPPIAGDGFYYRPFYNSAVSGPNNGGSQRLSGWDSPRRANISPRDRTALVTPMTPIIEDAPPGGYSPYPAF
jgi:hypothetical protein